MSPTLEMLAVTLNPVQTECMQKRRQTLIESENDKHISSIIGSLG